MKIGSVIAEERNKAGMTQQELSCRTGIQRANIARLENGKYNPTVDTLQKIAIGLNKNLIICFK